MTPKKFFFMLATGVCLSLFTAAPASACAGGDTLHEEVQRDLERLRRTNAGLGPDELAAKVINSQALFLGLTGALSGLGGLAFALVGMPIDLSVSTLRQMKMVHLLTAIYGNDDLNPEELEVRYMSLVLGGAGAAKLLLRLDVKLVGESIPLVGSVAGFGINWMITKSSGLFALIYAG